MSISSLSFFSSFFSTPPLIPPSPPPLYQNASQPKKQMFYEMLNPIVHGGGGKIHPPIAFNVNAPKLMNFFLSSFMTFHYCVSQVKKNLAPPNPIGSTVQA
jgi:hypothetical protein